MGLMNKDDIALFEKQKAENTQLFNEKQVLNHELSESGKNLYEAKNLLKMCRKEKEKLICEKEVARATGIELLKEMQVENRKLTLTISDKDDEIADLVRVIDESDDYNNGSYWPLCDVGDDAFLYSSVCLFLSVSVFCFTVYKIAQMIGF